MPLGDGRSDLLRRIEGVEGTVRMVHEWIVRFNYGRTRPWVARHTDDREDHTDEIITAIAGPDMLVLRGARLPHAQDGHHVDEFDVTAGQTFTFSTTWFRSHDEIPPPLRVRARIRETIARSEGYAARSDYVGPYAEAVTRSLLVLRGLTHQETGGIVAAPTTSLPEEFGGERNWDYRFCWLRDAALTLEALLGCGYVEETALWRDWLLRAVAGDPEDLQIMYRVDGGRDAARSASSTHLPGYAGVATRARSATPPSTSARPTCSGEVMIALDHARSRGLEETDDSWPLQRSLVNHLAEHWEERRQRPLGDPRARCGTSRTRAPWCGRPSTGPSVRSSSTGSTDRSSSGASCATRCARRS